LIIRLFELTDYDAVFQLWQKTPGLGLSRIDDSRAGIEKFLKRNPTTSFVAEDPDQGIVGAILCGHDGRRALVHHTCVDQRFLRRGIGEKLVSAVVEALRKEGINKAALVVFTGNDRGNRFWEKMGFTLREDLYHRNLELIDQNKE
jgi:ribosomal protein S18 acetylase RimI-like enzyme